MRKEPQVFTGPVILLQLLTVPPLQHSKDFSIQTKY